MSKLLAFAASAVLALSALPARAEEEGATQDAAKQFVTSFCFAVDKQDEAWLRGRVKLPLNARMAFVREGGSTRFEHKTLRTAKAVIEAKVCDGLDVENATVSASSRGWSVHVPGKGFEATMELERSPRVRLVSFLER